MLFSQKKPKEFNYKAKYIAEDSEEKKVRLKDKMYSRWDRMPYDKLKRKGQRRMFIRILALIGAIRGAMLLYDKMIEIF